MKSLLASSALALLGATSPAVAQKHCGLDVGDPNVVRMWTVTPAAKRQTTRELVVSLARAGERHRVCKEDGLTIVLRFRPGITTLYQIRD